MIQAWLRFTDSDSGEEFFVSDQGFLGRDAAAGSYRYVEGRVTSRIRYSDRAQTRLWGGGRGSFGFSEVRLNNADGGITDWPDRNFEDGAWFYIGDPETEWLITGPGTAKRYRVLRIRDITLRDSETMVVRFEDPFQISDLIVAMGSGYYDSTVPNADSIEGELIPFVAGKVYYAPVVLVDTAGFGKYEVHGKNRAGNGLSYNSIQVYDRGALLTGGGTNYTATNDGFDMVTNPDGHLNATVDLGPGEDTLLALDLTIRNYSVPNGFPGGFVDDVSLLQVHVALGSPEWGYVFSAGVYYSDFLQDIADSANAYWAYEGQSLFLKQLTYALHTPVLEIDDLDISGPIDRERDRAPGLTMNGVGRRNWSPVPPGEAADVASSKVELEWLKRRQASQAVIDALDPRYADAATRPPQIFYFNDAPEMVDELDRAGNLYARKRYFHRVPVQFSDDNFDDIVDRKFGDTIRLTSDLQAQLGLQFGTNLVLVGRDINWTTRTAIFTLWGTAGRYRTDAMDFGAADYYARGSALTGIADGKQGTLCIAIDPDDSTPSAYQEIFQLNFDSVLLRLNTDGSLRFRLESNVGGSVLLDFTTAAAILDLGQNMIHIGWDIDVGGANKCRIYVNDIDVTPATSFTDGTIDYTNAVSLGASPVGGDSYEGLISHVGFHTIFIDPDVEANRRRFFDEHNMPVFGGDDGSLAFGEQPFLWIPDGNGSRNLGSGGNLDTIGGAPTVASSSPTDDRGPI